MKIIHTPYDDQFLNGKTGSLVLSGASLDQEKFLDTAAGYDFIFAATGIHELNLIDALQDLNFRIVDYSLKPMLSVKLLTKGFREELNTTTSLSIKMDQLPEDSVIKILSENYSNQRFLRDPKISRERAIQRYAAWARDLNDKRYYFKCIKNEEIIGSMLVEIDNSQTRLLLTAMDPKIQKQGYGKYFWMEVIKKLRLLDQKFISTEISALNTHLIHFYNTLGFVLEEPQFKFHWHRN